MGHRDGQPENRSSGPPQGVPGHETEQCRLTCYSLSLGEQAYRPVVGSHHADDVAEHNDGDLDDRQGVSSTPGGSGAHEPGDGFGGFVDLGGGGVAAFGDGAGDAMAEVFFQQSECD